MTDDLDVALEGVPIAAPTFTGATGIKKHRHQWTPLEMRGENGPIVMGCRLCPARRDEQLARRGKSVLQRSKREERKLAHDYGGVRTGHHGGPDDVQTGLLNIQSKAGVGWWSTRYANELDKLPRTGGRVPALIISNGQPRRLVRRYVVIDEKDFRALYGDLILGGANAVAEGEAVE